MIFLQYSIAHNILTVLRQLSMQMVPNAKPIRNFAATNTNYTGQYPDLAIRPSAAPLCVGWKYFQEVTQLSIEDFQDARTSLMDHSCVLHSKLL